MIFEKVLLTLIQRDENDHVYKGGLPSPFVSQMNQFSVRSELGMPYKSIGPSKLPGSGSKKVVDGTHIDCIKKPIPASV